MGILLSRTSIRTISYPFQTSCAANMIPIKTHNIPVKKKINDKGLSHSTFNKWFKPMLNELMTNKATDKV